MHEGMKAMKGLPAEAIRQRLKRAGMGEHRAVIVSLSMGQPGGMSYPMKRKAYEKGDMSYPMRGKAYEKGDMYPMKGKASEKGDMASKKPNLPSLSLTEEEWYKLTGYELPKIGTTFHVMGTAKVESVSQSDYGDEPTGSVSLRFHDLSVEPEEEGEYNEDTMM